MYEYTNRLVEKLSKLAFNVLTVGAPLCFNFSKPIFIYYLYFATDSSNAVFDHAFEPFTFW